MPFRLPLVSFTQLWPAFRCDWDIESDGAEAKFRRESSAGKICTVPNSALMTYQLIAVIALIGLIRAA
jgi:hypothetical protein